MEKDTLSVTIRRCWQRKLFPRTLIAISLIMLSSTIYAWKPNTHVYLAEEVLKDALDGRVSIYRVDYEQGAVLTLLGEYSVDPQILSALQNYPEQFRAGVLGPDAYPDILTGQQVIHPEVSQPQGTNSWLEYLWELANTAGNGSGPVKAFVVGFLTHAAEDMYGHTFVNNYTGAPFELGQNAIKHIVLEGYVGKRTPEIRSANNMVITQDNISITGVEDFIYQNMVDARPGTVLNQRLLVSSGASTSVPKIYSDLRAGLQRDIDDYYRTKAEYDQLYDEKIRQAEDCEITDFTCSAFILSTEAAAIQAQKAAYVLANGPQTTYKERWVADIDSGLRAWPNTSHEIAKALVFSSTGTNTSRAEQVAQDYVYNHLLSMSGLPDAIGSSLAFIDSMLQAILPQTLVDAIAQMKRDLLNYIIQQAFGITIEEIEAYFRNPETYFDVVMNAGGPGQATTLQDFNTQVLHLSDTAYNDPAETFDYQTVPALYNTATFIKLLLLSRDEMNRLLRDLGSSQTLTAPNVMLGFIRSLDDDNEWHDRPEKMVLALDCNAYRAVFMRQIGEQGGCTSSVPAPLEDIYILLIVTSVKNWALRRVTCGKETT